VSWTWLSLVVSISPGGVIPTAAAGAGAPLASLRLAALRRALPPGWARDFPSGVPVIAIPYHEWSSQWHYKDRFSTETCQYEHEKNLVCILS
jgi:hypothetical protein